jgi:hypothetical protein
MSDVAAWLKELGLAIPAILPGFLRVSGSFGILTLVQRLLCIGADGERRSTSQSTRY